MNTNVSDVTKLKKVCVTKIGQKYFYPKTIPHERESMTHIYIGAISVLLLSHLYFTTDRSSFLSLYAFTLLFYFFIVLAFRVILLICETEHSVSRYENDFKKLLKAAFTFNYQTIIAFVACILYVVYDLAKNGSPSFQKEFWFVTVFLFLFHKILDLDSNPIFDSLGIAKSSGLDYGSGMAYSFFYGYFNYMLRKTGDQEKNLKELMQDYEAKNKIKFEVYKIFILIPKSLTCPVSIEDASKIMDMRGSLPEKIKTVAGVRDRVYKNSVYSIQHEKLSNPVYVCTEYATPLKTFKEVVKNMTLHTEYYTRHKNDILLQFYLTLKQILEHENMDSMCELVYYEDMDENNKFYDVGRILLDRIANNTKGEKQNFKKE